MMMRWRSDAAGGWAELGCCSGLLHLRQLGTHIHKWCQTLLQNTCRC